MPRFRFVRQRDAMQCGVACLTMVCRILGRQVSLETVAAHCGATVQGVSLKGIADAADDLGLDSAAARMTLAELAREPLPAILHWNQNHFVVLYRVSRRGARFHIADPGKGKYTCRTAAMEKHWLATSGAVAASATDAAKGIAMMFDPRDDFAARAEEERHSRRSIRFLFSYIKPYLRHLGLILGGLLVGCLLQLTMPFLTQWIVDVGIAGSDLGFIWLVLLGELMIVLGRTATDFIRSRLLTHISMRVNLALVRDFFIKLLRLPMGFFDTRLMGDLLQRIADHRRVQSFLTQELLDIVFTALSFVVFGAVLLVYNTGIFMVFLAGSIVYGGWIAWFLPRRRVLDYRLFEAQSVAQNRTYRFVTSMQEIKLQQCERRRRLEWEDSQADLFEIELENLRLRQTQEAGSIFINEVKNIVITVLAATCVINGSITLGAMLAIQYIVGQLNSPVSRIMSFIYTLQDVKISLERINEVHCGPNEENVSDSLLTTFPGDKSIVVSGLKFRYDRHNPALVLDNISLTVPEGKTTAIVGASGSGKTTLIKLMLGYYPPEKGEIEVAGAPLNAYSMRWWRSNCGAVMQDGVIFSESIARNIAVDDSEIDCERMRRAAATANVREWIESLPLRYDTVIGPDGLGISQGQRQRILIARAVYRDPDFIFLDEATNSLDAANERAIVENLAGFYRGRTVVVVAHRLSTVRHADNIIVLDGGRVAETGSHESLTALRGLYYNLVKNQLELGS